MSYKKHAAFLATKEMVDLVFGDEIVQEIKKICTLDVHYLTNITKETIKHILTDTEIILSTWGMPKIDDEILSAAPNLKIIIYGASSVKYFVTPSVFDKGIIVTSASVANGSAVAEFTLACITMSLKNIWPFVKSSAGTLLTRNDWTGFGGHYKKNIGVIGLSAVGKELIRLLQSYPSNILLYDPYVTESEAVRVGVKKCELKELMAKSDIVSLHAPNLDSLKHMITAEHLALMKDGSFFINTARGALVDEAALIAELETGRISACLDVTCPEPAAVDSPLYSLPNVVLTPHLAGTLGDDCKRMGAHCLQELHCYLEGKPQLNIVNQELYSIIN
jgi:phosphoglycerate dehydrogenase-like enzyme